MTDFEDHLAYLPDELPRLTGEDLEKHEAYLLLQDYESVVANLTSDSLPDLETTSLSARTLINTLQLKGFDLIYNFGDEIEYEPGNCFGQIGVDWQKGQKALISTPGIRKEDKVIWKATVWSMEGKDHPYFNQIKFLGDVLKMERSNKFMRSLRRMGLNFRK